MNPYEPPTAKEAARLVVRGRKLERPEMPAGAGPLIGGVALLGLVVVVVSMFVVHPVLDAVIATCLIGGTLGLCWIAWRAMTTLARGLVSLCMALAIAAAIMVGYEVRGAAAVGYVAFTLFVVLLALGVRRVRSVSPVMHGPQIVAMESWVYRTHVPGPQIAVELARDELRFVSGEGDPEVWKIEHVRDAKLEAQRLVLSDCFGDSVILALSDDAIAPAEELVAALPGR